MWNGETGIPRSSPPTLQRRGFNHENRMKENLPAAPQRGFTYIGLLIAITIIGVTLSSMGTVWHTSQQRDRERELLFIGDQIRQAIGRYYSAGVGSAKQYPQTLDDLLRDPRQPGVLRHLRKLYYDPITGTTDWGLIKDADDRIMGVFSLSEEQPIKQTGFSAADQDFEGKEKYSQWTFEYHPRLARVNRTTKGQTLPDALNTEPAREK